MSIYDVGTTPEIMFKMRSSADHLSAVTTGTPVVNIRKANGSWTTATNAATHTSFGWWRLILTSTETNTSGDLIFYITLTGADPKDIKLHIRDLVTQADVEAASVAALDVTMAEPPPGPLPVLASPKRVLQEKYKEMRNKLVIDATTGTAIKSVYQDDDTTVAYRQEVTVVGAVTTRSKASA